MELPIAPNPSGFDNVPPIRVWKMVTIAYPRTATAA